MRLKSVWISEYKNLRDFTLTFDEHSFLDIFVGKNGTGKSNFFEALVEIFRHIYDSRDRLDTVSFDYEITYEIGGTDTTIAFRDEVLMIDGRARRTVGRTPVPDNVLVYYSGHNPTINNTVSRYERAFADQSRSWDADAARKFIEVRADYKEMLLSVLLMQPDDCVARQYLCEKLNIDVVSRETFNLILKRPPFASRVQVDVADGETFLWGAQGAVRTFLDSLTDCIADGFTFGSIYDREAEQYKIPINMEHFRERFADIAAPELFRSFDQLKAIGMFAGLSVPLRLKSGDVAKVGDFSDGQFQSVYIFAISELFKDRNCITLLDEPDSFLHPEWQFGFLQQVVDIAGNEAAQTNHVLMTSHSASTIAQTEQPQIRMFEIGAAGVTVSAGDKSSIVRSLSAGLIVFSEREARLNIYHNLKNTAGHVLMVEGVSDEIILETAWRKLHGEGADRNFDILSAFACSTLGRLMRDNDFYNKHPNRTIFALFDWDKAYNDWNDGGSDLVEANPARCLVRKRRNQTGYNLMLPVPDGLTCRNQVVDAASGVHFAHNASLPIELLFIDTPGLTQHFGVDNERPGNCMKFQGNKVTFAKEVVPTLPTQAFENFRPIFNFIAQTL
ncbi:MAG: ATP-dependent nuclease [Alphaproteobacteria bacterium]